MENKEDRQTRKLLLSTAIMASNLLGKLNKSKKLRNKMSEKDMDRMNLIRGLAWALCDIDDVVASLKVGHCSNYIVAAVLDVEILLCDKLNELIKNSCRLDCG